MAIGRPVLYKTAEQFTEAADHYFDSCLELEATATVNGLCLRLGMCRETLWDYAKKPEFSHAVKFARMRLEHSWEQRLAGPNATGTIFWLKNQGWSDTTKVEMNANVASVSRIELVAPDLDDNGAA